ncbi:MAG: HEPN domain-containing protein [Planctomycetota bacterium]
MPHDPALIAETKAWLTRALRDLEAATFELQADPPFAEDIAFHAQQAAEKSLKAFLCFHQHRFRKTHDLTELGEAVVSLRPELEPLLRRAAPLTEYAWRFRYPGDIEVPTREEAEDALAIGRSVFETILDRVPGDARP